MISLVAIADPHIGGQRWGVSAEEWCRPIFEAVEYAVEHSVDYFMVAGDVFHSRRPTPDDYVVWQEVEARLTLRNIGIVKVPGNHDEPAAAGRANTLWPDADPISGFSLRDFDDISVIRLGWPRPVDFIASDYLKTLSIDEAIAVTREEVLNWLRAVSTPTERPTILLGHCMVSYGGVKADDPGLILGKDVVLPAEELRALPALPILGHVHRPDSLYVGSTQPTDFGEAGHAKNFWHIRISGEDDVRGGVTLNSHRYVIGNFTYDVETIRYDTNLRLLDLAFTDWPEGAYIGDGYDIARARITTEKDIDPATIRKLLLRHAKRVHSVEVIRPRRTVARVETATPLAAMSPLEAFDAWLQDLVGSEEGKAARELFHRMVTQ